MRFRLSFIALLVGIFFAVVSFGRAQVQSKAAVERNTKHAASRPLREIVPIVPQSLSSLNDDDDDRLLTYGTQATSQVQDSVLQISPSTSISTNLGLDILGIGTGFTGYSTQATVPDTNGAAGPTQFVQWANESFAVFNKSDGSVAYGVASGNTLWQALGGACAASPNLDGIVQFDKLASRWVILMPVFAAPPYLCLAVSQTTDATGAWNLYSFQPPANKVCGCRLTPDYPKLAVWPDGYYITYNQGYNNMFEGAAACVVDRNSMLKGAAATMQCFVNISSSYGSLLPADVDGTTPPPAGSPEYLLNFDGNNQSLDLWRLHVDWTTPANTTLTGPANIPVAAFTEACGETIVELNYTTGACIPQQGTSQMLDSYGDRVMYRLAYRNFPTHQSLLINHSVNTGTGTQTGIRWYELQNTSGTFGLYQEGTYAPDSNYRWMGSIAMDKAGDIALGYSVSSATMSPSIRYTGRVPSDPLGQMDSEIDILSAKSVSHGSQTNTFHWGDYSSLAIDSTDDCTFWYTSEYLPVTGGRWGTRIAAFSFPSCTTTTQNYTLTVNESGQGTVTSTDGQINCTNGSGTCSAVYPSGTVVTMNATAASGWTFSGWSGPCSGGNPCNLVVNSNLNPLATFTAPITPWAIVNKASLAGNPITSLTIPATGSGHLIAVALMFTGSTSVAGISDNATGGSNTYVSAGARATASSWSTEIWYAVNSKSGATIVTPTFVASPNHVEITVWEVSGISTSAPDATNTSSGTVVLNNTPGPAVTTTQAGDFILSVLAASTASFSGMSSGNEFTDDFKTNGNGWAHITSTSAAAGTHQASWYTSSPGGIYCASTVAFLP